MPVAGSMFRAKSARACCAPASCSPSSAFASPRTSRCPSSLDGRLLRILGPRSRSGYSAGVVPSFGVAAPTLGGSCSGFALLYSSGSSNATAWACSICGSKNVSLVCITSLMPATGPLNDRVAGTSLTTGLPLISSRSASKRRT